MKISIVTITFNSVKTVESTIRSVIEQDHSDIEYVIVDGGSTDGTLDIIKKYESKIDQFISEKDDGLYFALNKGIDMCTGDVIGILHSDDTYSNNKVLSKVANSFEMDKDLEGLYADLVFVDRDQPTRIVRTWKAGEYNDGKFLKGWMPPHPTFFVKGEIYKKFGGFNTDFELSADYELMLRLIHKNKIKVKYLPETIVEMKMGGVSNTSVYGKVKANIEDQKAWKVNGLKPGLLTTIWKPLSKVSQYFKSDP